MKSFETVMKVLTVLAAVAGVVVILAAYGDKIVEWAKKLMAQIPCHNCDIIEFTPAEDFDDEVEEAPVEASGDEAAEEPVAAPVEGEPVAEDADFQA